VPSQGRNISEIALKEPLEATPALIPHHQHLEACVLGDQFQAVFSGPIVHLVFDGMDGSDQIYLAAG
jgi:hypothetical protein